MRYGIEFLRRRVFSEEQLVTANDSVKLCKYIHDLHINKSAGPSQFYTAVSKNQTGVNSTRV